MFLSSLKFEFICHPDCQPFRGSEAEEEKQVESKHITKATISFSSLRLWRRSFFRDAKWSVGIGPGVIHSEDPIRVFVQSTDVRELDHKKLSSIGSSLNKCFFEQQFDLESQSELSGDLFYASTKNLISSIIFDFKVFAVHTQSFQASSRVQWSMESNPGRPFLDPGLFTIDTDIGNHQQKLLG